MKGPAEIVHGPIFIGFMFNVLLYGMMIAQSYIYYTTYKEDKRRIKLFVLLILVGDTVNTVFDLMYLYRALITHYGDINFLATADWLFATEPATTGIVATLVQFFFAWRLGALMRSWLLVTVVCLGAISGGASAVATSFEIGRTPHYADFRDFKSVVIVWLASAAITDLIITTILAWYLVSVYTTSIHNHKSGFKESDLMVDRIIRLTVQTGLITSVVAILDLIFFLAYPTGLHLLFSFPLCKLYSNSLMSSLNSRRGWRFRLSDQEYCNVHSGVNLGILLTANALTSPPLSSSSPMGPLGGPYNNVNGDGSLLTSHERKEHSSCVIIPPDAMHLGKGIRPHMLGHVESHELRDIIGNRQQELPRSPKQRAMNTALSIDTEMNQRMTSQAKDEENENEQSSYTESRSKS